MKVFLSASSLKDFIKCSQKVHYRLSKEIKEEKSVEMIVGTVVHSSIERYWNDEKKAHKSAEQTCKSLGVSGTYLDNTHFYLNTFFDCFVSALSVDDSIEHNFKIPLYDDVFIVGKMDRISRGNVFDWKTGTIRSKRLGNDPQCIIYQYAYEQLYNKKPNGVFLASLSTGELIPYVESSIHTDELFTNIIPRMVKTIRSGNYEKLGLFNGGCFRCPYKTGCLKLGEEDVVDYSIVAE